MSAVLGPNRGAKSPNPRETRMITETPKLPESVIHEDGKFNLYHINEVYKVLAHKISQQLTDDLKTEIHITSGMWADPI